MFKVAFNYHNSEHTFLVGIQNQCEGKFCIYQINKMDFAFGEEKCSTDARYKIFFIHTIHFRFGFSEQIGLRRDLQFRISCS